MDGWILMKTANYLDA